MINKPLLIQKNNSLSNTETFQSETLNTALSISTNQTLDNSLLDRTELNYKSHQGNRLIDFYINNAPNDQNLTLDEILKKPHSWLNSERNYIYWLFPITSVNRFKDRISQTPSLDLYVLSVFNENQAFRDNLSQSLDCLLHFYGFIRPDNNASIRPNSNFTNNAKYWFTKPTFHDLRITRILSSLYQLSQEDYAVSFLNALKEVSTLPSCGFNEYSIEIWTKAIPSLFIKEYNLNILKNKEGMNNDLQKFI